MLRPPRCVVPSCMCSPLTVDSHSSLSLERQALGTLTIKCDRFAALSRDRAEVICSSSLTAIDP